MPSPAVYRRRRLVAIIVLIAVISLTWTVISSLTPQRSSENSISASLSGTEPQNFTQPGEPPFLPSEGSSAIGVAGIGVIASNGISEPVPIASIAKTITTLVILDKLAPEYGKSNQIQISFDEKDEEIRAQTIAENGASQPVSKGLSMSLHEALSVMMLASANNYATSLAIKTFGSMDAYIEAANNWLASNGMTNTKVADASGLNPETKGTAEDLVNLGLIAMDNQEVVDIVTNPEITVSGVGTIKNGNPMFGIDGVDGIKLGSTFEANNCLLYSKVSEVDGRPVRIVGVTLGLDEFSTIIEYATQTLNQISAGLVFKELIPAGSTFGVLSSSDGKQSSIVNKEPFTSIYWPGVSFIATPQIREGISTSTNEVPGELTIQLGQRYHKLPLTIQ